VQAGIMKMKIHVSQMRRAEEEPKPKKKTGGGGKVSLVEKSVSMECDVRGLNLEEAILSVDLYLDNCILHSLKQVHIIHGKGTGILRSGIQAHLKKHKAVQEFRLGRYGEGEDGVTVVTLK
jgi:DNA mismatch repair protein MutS2